MIRWVTNSCVPGGALVSPGVWRVVCTHLPLTKIQPPVSSVACLGALGAAGAGLVWSGRSITGAGRAGVVGLAGWPVGCIIPGKDAEGGLGSLPGSGTAGSGGGDLGAGGGVAAGFSGGGAI